MSLLLLTLALQTVESPPTRPSNHLAGQTSPYLLQHVHNPVDWYPWGEEALAKAQAEDKPIFLSIGYAACHWCHVMEHESFEDEGIAAYLNEHFVSIKVDREERPDLDDLYMAFVQRATGSGGWPMTVFLTPERLPFYGGTYFPPQERFGRPGFAQVLAGVQQAWSDRRDEVRQSAAQYGDLLRLSFPVLAADAALPTPAELAEAQAAWVQALAAVHDRTYGGFGQAPKFPRAEDLRFLLRAADAAADGGDEARTMVSRTLRAMAAGGMYDQLGGGFARYSVDAQWLIPHFEKMLYDQGTLVPLYLETWERDGEPRWEAVVRATCDYLLRERQDAGGAFWSSSDADSEGVEGKFFAWTPAQLDEVLGAERGAFAAAYYGVRDDGNFEHGWSVLTTAATPAEAARQAGLTEVDAEALAEEVRAALYTARLQRIQPHDDDKILTAWNGLAIDALARAGRVLGEPRYLAAAERAADFLLAELRVAAEDGGAPVWRRAWRAGQAQHRAVLEDHAYLCRGLLALFQATGEERWLDEAVDLGERMLEAFGDPESALFWDTDGGDATLLQRLKSPWDGATPSPNGVALECLAVLHAFTQDPAWRAALRRGAAAIWPMMRDNPRAFLGSTRALAWAVEEPAVAVVIGSGSATGGADLAREGSDPFGGWREALRGAAYRDALPVLRAVAALAGALGLFQARPTLGGAATLYLCRGSTCEAPTASPRGTR